MKNIVLIAVAALALSACDQVQQSATEAVQNQVQSTVDKTVADNLDQISTNDPKLQKMLADAKADGKVTAQERDAIIDAATKSKVQSAIDYIGVPGLTL